MGFIVGTSAISVLYDCWGMFLITWALMVITLRIGGRKLYESVGVPIADGFVVGDVIAMIIVDAMGVLRFSVPY